MIRVWAVLRVLLLTLLLATLAAGCLHLVAQWSYWLVPER